MEDKIKSRTFADEIRIKDTATMEQKKMQMSQDDFYQYLTKHDVKLSRLAELMGKSLPVLSSAFLHHKNNAGYERNFSVENIARLNQSLPILADELRQFVMTFGSEQTFTNKHGTTYDPALLEPIKRLGRYLNLVTLTERILGWNKTRKRNVLADTHSKVYGCISQSDMMALNAELLAIAGVLGGTEVIPDNDAYDPEATRLINPEKQDDKPSKTKKEKGTPAPVRNEWDDTSLDLWERDAAFHRLFPDGLIAFSVNDGFTVCEDNARLLARIDTTLKPYTEPFTGHVTLYMDADKWKQIRRAWDDGDEMVAESPMHEK